MVMNRRAFLKSVATGAAALAGMGALGEVFIPFSEALDVPKLSFAHITDLHLDVNFKGENNWQYREKSVPLFLDAMVQLGRLPKPNFVVFGGDQIHYGLNDRDSLELFQKTTNELSMPFYILLGNTEVSPLSGVSRLRRDDYLKAWSGRGLAPGQSSWAFNPLPNVRVIGFDVTADGKAHGEAGPLQLKWLENDLEENRAKKLIMIFTHQLIMPTTPKDLTPGWSVWMVKNHEKVRQLIEKFPNVRLVISGHHHASKVETAGQVTYVSDPAIVTYPCAFRTYTITRDGIHLKNIELDDRAIVDRAKELLASDPYAKMYDPVAPVKAVQYSMGLAESDRETTIKID